LKSRRQKCDIQKAICVYFSSNAGEREERDINNKVLSFDALRRARRATLCAKSLRDAEISRFNHTAAKYICGEKCVAQISSS
jgi:hypothetical protein